jgi:hypothetical protein
MHMGATVYSMTSNLLHGFDGVCCSVIIDFNIIIIYNVEIGIIGMCHPNDAVILRGFVTGHRVNRNGLLSHCICSGRSGAWMKRNYSGQVEALAAETVRT